MSFGVAIFATLFFADAFATIQYPNLSSYSPPLRSFDTAALRLELSIRSSGSPEWYRAGMQRFAFELMGVRWNKKDITWGIEQDSTIISKSIVIDMLTEAFAKWSVQSSLNISGPVAQPDIRIKFVPKLEGDRLGRMEFIQGGEFERGIYIADSKGARIYITDDINPADLNDEFYAKAHNMLLRQIGFCLGLDFSPVVNTVMNRSKKHIRMKTRKQLHTDDIDGIRSLYGPPQSATVQSRAPPSGTNWNRRQPPAPSSPQSSTSSSSDDD